MNSENILRAMSGKPHQAMTLDQVMNAIAKGENYIAEPGYMEEIIRLARQGQRLEAENERLKAILAVVKKSQQEPWDMVLFDEAYEAVNSNG